MDFNRMTCMVTLALAGCTQLNPAFEGGDDNTIGAGSETVGESTDSMSEAGSAEAEGDGDGDGDPTGDGDGEPTGDGDGDPGDGDGDEACDLELREGLDFEIDVGDEGCPQQWVVVKIGNNPTSGDMVNANACAGDDCSECIVPITFGIPNYSSFTTSLDAQLDAAMLDNADTVCARIELRGLVMDGANANCRYASASVFELEAIGPLLIFNRDEADLTPQATTALGGSAPHPGSALLGCTCEGMWSDDNATCCMSTRSQTDPHEFEFVVENTARAPGSDPFEISIGETTWMFDVVQAQHIPRCDDNQGIMDRPESTWTMVRALP